MSYIGLFSFYNSTTGPTNLRMFPRNTPWFFNGLRVSDFSQPSFEDEPWFINWMAIVCQPTSRKGVGGRLSGSQTWCETSFLTTTGSAMTTFTYRTAAGVHD